MPARLRTAAHRFAHILRYRPRTELRRATPLPTARPRRRPLLASSPHGSGQEPRWRESVAPPTAAHISLAKATAVSPATPGGRARRELLAPMPAFVLAKVCGDGAHWRSRHRATRREIKDAHVQGCALACSFARLLSWLPAQIAACLWGCLATHFSDRHACLPCWWLAHCPPAGVAAPPSHGHRAVWRGLSSKSEPRAPAYPPRASLPSDPGRSQCSASMLIQVRKLQGRSWPDLGDTPSDFGSMCPTAPSHRPSVRTSLGLAHRRIQMDLVEMSQCLEEQRCPRIRRSISPQSVGGSLPPQAPLRAPKIAQRGHAKAGERELRAPQKMSSQRGTLWRAKYTVPNAPLPNCRSSV